MPASARKRRSAKLLWMKRLPRGVRARVASLVQRLGELKRGPAVLPRPPWTALDAIPVIGFNLVDAIFISASLAVAPASARFSWLKFTGCDCAPEVMP